MPAFSFYLPIYSFWHFDDFSWGNTRVVYGEKNRKGKFTSDVTDFDPKTIPLRKWEVFESRRRDSLDSRRNDFQFDEKLEFGDETQSLRSISTAVSSQRQSLPPFTRLATNSPMGIHNHHRGSRDSSLYDGYFTPTRGPSIYKEYNQMLQISGSTAHSAKSPLGSDGSSKRSSPKFPSDEAILYQIRLIISSSDLNTLTKRGVRDQLGTIFNMDMRAKKSTISYFLEEILKGTM
jgi:chitin synthase